MEIKSIKLACLFTILILAASAFTRQGNTFSDEWYVLKTTECIDPHYFAGLPTRPINQIGRYQASNLNSSQAERFSNSEASNLCVSTFDIFICAIQLEGADVNSDDQISAAELNNKLAMTNYNYPQGILYKDCD